MMMQTLRLMEKYGFSIEEVDMITGSPLGGPNTATFRLSDMVGIDTLMHASKNSYDNCPNDEARDTCKPPAFLTKMVEQKMLGDKTGKGFYAKTPEKKILALDLKTFEYHDKLEPRFDCVRAAKSYTNPGARILTMMTYGAEDKVSKFSRELMLGAAAYALNRVGEVADDIPTIDNALKWGFAKEVGPIELLDVVGCDKAARMMQDVGIKVPKLLEEVINTTGRIYEPAIDGSTIFFDVAQKKMKTETPDPAVIGLGVLRSQGLVVRENVNARLLNLGDGVLCCELDAKMVPTMNPVDDYIISMMQQAKELCDSGKFKALVISNQASNFCAGAQLQMILELCKAKKWKLIEAVSRDLQEINVGLYHAGFPVVTAPHGMTLGGGLEITLAGHKRVPYTELYCGLVEVGVGLIPAGGGCMGLLRQFQQVLAKANPGPMAVTMKAFENIGFGKVSMSAHDAIDKGLLAKDTTVIAYNKDRQVALAKQVALDMLKDFKPIPKEDLILPGRGGYWVIDENVDGFVVAGTITEHSAKIAKIHANGLTGGENASPVNPVSEEYILELEREAFVKLCAEPMSQERMSHMLKKGKPLIN